MAISYVSSTSQAATSISSMPSHSSGDMILIVALQTDTTTPSLGSGYTSAASGLGYRIGFKVATSGSETSGTWTNASILFCHVYRGTSLTSPIGGVSVGSGTSNSITYPAVTFTGPSGSWGASAAYSTWTSPTTPVVPTPAGFTSRTNLGVSSSYDSRSADTNGIVSSISEDGPTSMGPHSYPWRSLSFELVVGSGNALFWAFP